MSTTRRVPLSNNPNVANSPMRASAAALQGAKKSRSHAEMLREEAYGQPPPAKRQMIERGVPSPTRPKTTRTIVHRSAPRTTAVSSRTQKAAEAAPYQPTEKEMEQMQLWHTNTRAAFPKMVFYFESIPDDQRAKFAKQVALLGAREEKFFSINITHVVTTRSIPPVKKQQDENQAVADAEAADEQPQTINPSLLNRTTTSTSQPVRRKLVFDTTSSRKHPLQPHEDPIRRPKARSTDILDRARDMGKKIWPLDKLQKILSYVLHPDAYINAALGLGRANTRSATKAIEQANLAQVLREERMNGPSDRDPTVSTKELYYFKGPFIYVYDIDEKTKPIMVREYPKAPDPRDGEWPQFRITSNGRCPFVPDESYDVPEKRDRDRERERERTRAKERAARAAAESVAREPKPSTAPPPKPTASKRTLSQMEDGHNRGAASVRATESFDRSRVSNPPSLEFATQNAFMSHAKPGRLLAGEPVASGVQPSNITSAIRSQMVSSTGGLLGAKAGTSKEIHGLQRRVVLQKASTPALSQDPSSRRMAEVSHDGSTFVRSASVSTATHRKLDTVDEKEVPRQREKLRRTVSVPVSQPRPKRDPKPGYCENCQDKFADFEEHIVSRTHRKFAENDDNWAQLDALLSQIKRVPRY